jgi:hypothetical protein
MNGGSPRGRDLGRADAPFDSRRGARKDLHPEACPRLPILKHLERVVVASAVIGNPHG